MINIVCYPKHNIFLDILDSDLFVDRIKFQFVDQIDFTEINSYDIFLIVLTKDYNFNELSIKIKNKISIPIVILDDIYDETRVLFAFENHVYDYIINPYSSLFLLYKFESILYNVRKCNMNELLVRNDMYLEMTKQNVYIDNKRIMLTTKEFQLLKYLVDHRNEVCKKEDIIKFVWEYEDGKDFRTLETHIKTLRKKLGKYESNIVTHRSIGYSFNTYN